MSRPEAFQVDVDAANCKLIVRMDPLVAAHRAAAHLCDSGGDISVEYQLAELSSVSQRPSF